MQYLVSSLFCRRMFANPKVAKPLLELVLGVAVVISMEHTQEYALTKAARANKEEVVWIFFQLGQVHRLVHVIEVLFCYLYEILDSIRYAFHCVLLHIAQ